MTPIRADSVSGDESLTTRLARLRLPVGAALGMFVALYAATTIRLLRVTEGHFTYALDDAYIHMAIAKNLALHGVWGLQQDSFAAASSSPLWTALLAAVFALGGVHEAVPLVLNTAFAVIGIVALGVILERERIFGLPMFGVIAAVVLFAPTVPMIWIGMEHSLHILLTLIVASLCGGLVRRYSAVRLTALCAAAALMVATRYEGLFVVAGCVVVLVARKRRGGAAALLAAGALPVACVGLWNMSHGWFFLPASIMMKQTVLPDSVGGTLWSSLLANIVHAAKPGLFMKVRQSLIMCVGFV